MTIHPDHTGVDAEGWPARSQNRSACAAVGLASVQP